MLLRTLTLLAAPLLVAAADGLSIVWPGPTRWWVNESENKIAWTGTMPTTDFQIFLHNPDNAVIAGGDMAIVAQGATYQYSIAVPPTKFPVAQNYSIRIVNRMNGTEIYAESDKFEIKPVGSTYPPQDMPGSANASSSASGSGSAAPTAAATTSPSATQKGGASRNVVALPVAAAAIAAVVLY